MASVYSLPPWSTTFSRPASARAPPSAPVRKIRSPPITGDECPNGTGVFQTTFLPGPNCTGRRVASPTPLPLGPRNCDQSAAKLVVAAIVIASTRQSISITLTCSDLCYDKPTFTSEEVL